MVGPHKAGLVLLMASGYESCSVRALGGGVFLLAARPLVSAWESTWNREGFGIWPVLFTLYFSRAFLFFPLFALPCIISCLHLVWTAVVGLREVANPDTFLESGALYAGRTKKATLYRWSIKVNAVKNYVKELLMYICVCTVKKCMVPLTVVHEKQPFPFA